VLEAVIEQEHVRFNLVAENRRILNLVRRRA